MDIPKLKSLIEQDHPVTGAFDADNFNAAIEMNVPNIVQNVTSVTGRQISAEIDEAEYIALSDEKKSQFLSLVGAQDIDPFGLATKVIKDIFGNGSTTIGNLAGIRTETVSLAKANGLGEIKEGHIENARF